MSETYSGDIAVDSDDEGELKVQTTGFKAPANYKGSDKDLHQHLKEMDKKALIKLVTGLGKNELRHTNFNIAILRERMQHFEKAIEELEKSIEFKKNKADKYRSMGEDPSRSIKATKRIIKNNEKRVEDLQKEVNKFEEKKAKKAIEQQNAKKEITKKMVKNIYKFLEKDSDPILVRLLEAFVAMLRNRPTANKEDVELYLQKYEGLVTAMNKVDPRRISGGNAKNYTDTIQAIRNEFTGDSKYVKYIPILVFLNQTCAMVNLTVEERVIEQQIQELEQDTKDREKEIEEIETFQQHVHEIIDFDIQVEQEQKQLALFKNHYSLLELRAKKLTRCTRFFERYFYDEVKNQDKLRSMGLERIDKMDDLDKIEDISEHLANLNLAKTVTKYKREENGANPVGSSKKANQLEAKAKKGEDQQKSDSESESGDDNEASEGSDNSDESEEESKEVTGGDVDLQVKDYDDESVEQSGVTESKDQADANSDDSDDDQQESESG